MSRFAYRLPKHPPKRPLGFTLLEVLVALGIVAVVAVLSWRGLQEVLSGVQALQRQDRDLQTAMAVFAQLEADLNTLHPLPALGPGQAAVQLNDQGLALQGSTHGSALQPQAPSPKRIAWRWAAQGLERQAQLLQTPPAPEAQPVVFSNLQGLQLRLLYPGGRWGPAQAFGQTPALPAADLVLQGQSLESASGRPPTSPPESAATPAPAALALEVTVSTAQHSWVRLLPLGVALVAGQKEKP